MIHHIATVILLAYSYWVNFTRIGVMVLLLHDVGDIFLEAAKLARWVPQALGNPWATSGNTGSWLHNH
jgi:hypothetical protein